MSLITTLQVLTFGLSLWFGLYLLNRDVGKPGLRFAGLGLLAYALGLALDSLSRYVPELSRWTWPLVLLPALFWFGAAVYLLPDWHPLRVRWTSRYDDGLLFASSAFYFAAVAIDAREGAFYWVFTLLAAFPLVLALGLLWNALRRSDQRGASGILFTAAIFFGLGLGLMIVPLDWLPREIVLLSLSFDLCLLGYTIAALDAFNEGEALLPDFLRSLGASAFAGIIFGGQVALVMALAGFSPVLLALLLAMVATAIAIQVYADPLQSALDRLAFARFPRLRHSRAELRAAASALPRENPSLDLIAMDEAEFARLTRAALSHMGDLGRLAASPLTRLPIIDTRMDGRVGNTLERAAELKALLAESIERLKPRGKGNFGTSDEWRFYNALYFPYVAGLKPYSRRDLPDDLDSSAQQALDWFRANVPERTLYNWQTAGAKLIAQDLREGILVMSNELKLLGRVDTTHRVE